MTKFSFSRAIVENQQLFSLVMTYYFLHQSTNECYLFIYFFSMSIIRNNVVLYATNSPIIWMLKTVTHGQMTRNVKSTDYQNSREFIL